MKSSMKLEDSINIYQTHKCAMLFGVCIKMYVFVCHHGGIGQDLCAFAPVEDISHPGLWPRTPATHHLSAKAQLYLKHNFT